VVSEPLSVCILQTEGGREEKEHSDTCQKWYQSLTLFVYFRQREQEGKYSDIQQSGIRGSLQRQAEGRQSDGSSVVIVAGAQQSIDSQVDCKERLEALSVAE
jgi:hypothetical protein